MTTPTYQEDGLVVIDNVLSPEQFTAARHQIANVDYQTVHPMQWLKVWRLWDGNPQRGQTIYYDPEGLFKWPVVYPTGQPIDSVIDALRALAWAFPKAVGTEGKDWAGIQVCPWLYPPGSALSLHWDGNAYSGAFTYYLHERWGTHWGGELVVYPGRPIVPLDGELCMAEHGDEAYLDNGIGRSIEARPNRLCLIGPDRPHRIARVDQNAGTHVRMSVGGFFMPRPIHDHDHSHGT